jgi:hypothetical protein
MAVRIQLGGDPESMRSLARWLRDDLARRVDDGVEVVRRAKGHTAEAWLDGRSLLFLLALESGGRSAHAFVTKIEKLATLLDDCADQLAYARGQMSLAHEQVVANRLHMTEGWIHCPQEFDAENEPPMGSPLTRAQIFQTRMDAYLEVDDMVERACQVTVELLDKVDHAWKTYWSTHAFTGGDFVVRETHALARWYEHRYLTDAKHARTWGNYWSDQARRWPPLVDEGGSIARNRAKEYRYSAMTRQAGVRAGIAATALSRVSAVLLPVSITWAISEGTPPAKAVMSGGFGVLGGALGAAAVGSATGGIGWIAIGLGGFIGAFVGAGAGNLAYDWLDPDGSWTPEPAWQKLLREDVDMDPGPRATRAE